MEIKGDESASDSESDEQKFGSKDEEQAENMHGFVELSYEVLFMPDEEAEIVTDSRNQA